MLTLLLSSSSISSRTSPVPWGLKNRDSLYFTASTNRLTRPDEYELEVLVAGVKTESEQLASDLLPVHIVQEHLPLIQGPDGGIQ